MYIRVFYFFEQVYIRVKGTIIALKLNLQRSKTKPKKEQIAKNKKKQFKDLARRYRSCVTMSPGMRRARLSLLGLTLMTDAYIL